MTRHNTEQRMAKKEIIHKLARELTENIDADSVCAAMRCYKELGQELAYLRCDCLADGCDN